MRRRIILTLCAVIGLFAAGCPKGNEHYKAARKAEDLQDYDTALQYYQKALAEDPQGDAEGPRRRLRRARSFHPQSGVASSDRR